MMMDSVTGVKRLQNDLISRYELIHDLSYVPPELLSDRKYLYARIMKLHTVDAAPVVHGRWVGIEYDGYADGNPVYDLWECSVCAEEHKGELDTLSNYCPNCGAKMW